MTESPSRSVAKSRLVEALVLDAKFNKSPTDPTATNRVEEDYVPYTPREQHLQMLYKAGKKIGKRYALVTVVFNEQTEALEFTVYVAQTCSIYVVRCAHPDLTTATMQQKKQVARTLISRLVWESPEQIGLSRIR